MANAEHNQFFLSKLIHLETQNFIIKTKFSAHDNSYFKFHQYLLLI